VSRIEEEVGKTILLVVFDNPAAFSLVSGLPSQNLASSAAVHFDLE
jgi:hypothetical protein